MEAINFERKQLLQQWKSALIGMQRRDEALQATEDALLKQREQEMALESEILGVKKAIGQEEQTNETLCNTEGKLAAATAALDAPPPCVYTRGDAFAALSKDARDRLEAASPRAPPGQPDIKEHKELKD